MQVNLVHVTGRFTFTSNVAPGCPQQLRRATRSSIGVTLRRFAYSHGAAREWLLRGKLGGAIDRLLLAVQRLSPFRSRGPKAAIRQLRDTTR